MARRLLDPQSLGRISRLELVARQAVEGFLSGLHPSPYHGSSVEYADHRPYTMGDEIRSIDWKLLAKTDKYYIKLFEEQTNARCTLVLDASNSMSFAHEHGPKFDYAARLSAMLAYLMVRQNDAVGLALFDHDVREYLPARSTATHFRVIIEAMEQARPGQDTRLGSALHKVAGRLRQRGVVVVISDLLDEPQRLIDGLAHFRFRRHEVIVFHVMDPAELDFPFDRLTRFRDLEGATTVITNPHNVKRRYQERLNAHLHTVRRACLERDISYVLARTDTPCEQMLSAYLEKRSRATK
jgi:uncharacterized protein (DUF58 family)